MFLKVIILYTVVIISYSECIVSEDRLQQIAINLSDLLWSVNSTTSQISSSVENIAVNGSAIAENVAMTISNHLIIIKDLLNETASRAVRLYSKHQNQNCCSSVCQYGMGFNQGLCSMSCNRSSIQYITTGRRYGIETGENGTQQCIMSGIWEDDDSCSAIENDDIIMVVDITSAVHIPRDMYHEDGDVLCFVQWTNHLLNSSVNFTSLLISAQYVGTVTRLFRLSPPSDWSAVSQCERCPLTLQDTFELGRRPWYTNTVTGNKFLLILLDVSGSMAGFQSILARTTIIELLKALTSNDYFLIIQVGEGERTKNVGCFTNKTRATPENVLVMNEIIRTLPDTNNRGRALFTKPIKNAVRLLGNSMECHRVLIIFTDGESESQLSYDINNSGLEVQVFTFLMGYGQDNANLKKLACDNRGRMGHIREYSDIIPAVLMIIKSLTVNPNSTDVHYTTYRSIHGDITLTMARPLWTTDDVMREALIGIVGLDIDHEQLLSSLLKQQNIGASGYGFIVDNNGQLLNHPFISQSFIQGLSDDSLFSLDMDWYEHAVDYSQWEMVREGILSGGCGQHTLLTWATIEREQSYVLRNTTYSYAPIDGTPYMVVIVTPADLWVINDEHNNMSCDGFTQLGGRGQCESGCGHCKGLQLIEGSPTTLTIYTAGDICDNDTSVIIMRGISGGLQLEQIVRVASIELSNEEINELLAMATDDGEIVYLLDQMANIIAGTHHVQMGWFPALYPDIQSDLVMKGVFNNGLIRGYEITPEGNNLYVNELNVYQINEQFISITNNTLNYTAVHVPNTSLTLLTLSGATLHGNTTECINRPIRLHSISCVCNMSCDKYWRSPDRCHIDFNKQLCSTSRTYPLLVVVIATSILNLII